jgi:Ca-activated chloride channel homolog
MRMMPILGVAAMLFATPVAAQQPQPTPPPAGQDDQPVVTFKAGIDLVRLSAVVRDRKGRFVQDLKATDFQISDGGITRTISEFRRDESPISVALLFDVSGSMEARMAPAREAATHVLNWLKDPDDEAAVFTFDTRLAEARPFTKGMHTLPEELSSVRPFGATSLHDAIAQTAERLSTRDSLRRAVVVFTDGQDTASKLSASEVSSLASSIDVPVYIIGIVPSIDNPLGDNAAITVERSALVSSLSNLAYWTGGQVFVVSSIVERSVMARQLVEELRHQYLIAFESSGVPGWHPLEIRTHNRELHVRARSGYIAGQSRPSSN